MVEEKVVRYDIFQRVYHWVNLASLLILLWGGLTIFDLNILGVRPFSAIAQVVIGQNYTPLVADLHKYASFILLGSLIFHIGYDTGIKGLFWSELPSKAELKAQNIMAANFLGRSKVYVKFHKYNPGQKMLHIGFAFVILLIGATGLMLSANYRWMVPVWWLNIDFDFLNYWTRVIHDLLTFVLITMVIMHFYFAVRRENLPSFKSMIVGWVPKSFQDQHFAKGEEPELIIPKSEAGKK